MKLRINKEALEYIEQHKEKFENSIPSLNDEWTLVRVVKYPTACGGEPVVELEKDKEWMRIPADIFRLSDIVGNFEA